MATVRITGNTRNANREEWVGAPEVDPQGHVARSVALPEEAYVAIERGIRRGAIEGVVHLPNGSHLNWFLDRPWGVATAAAAPAVKPAPAGQFRNIIIPADLSDRHGRAVEVAAGLTAEGGEVTLLHVTETIEGLSREEAADFYGQLEAKAEEHLGRLLAQLRQRGVAGRVLVLRGKCVPEVVQFAARSGADLIVLASHPIGTSAGWGTRSYQIAVVAPCPVMLVK